MSRRRLWPSLAIVLLVFSVRSPSPAVSLASTVSPSGLDPLGVYCPALPPPPIHKIVNVSTAGELRSAVDGASPGDVILVADGTYDLYSGMHLWVDTPDVTIRSASGYRDAVILDGHYDLTEIVTIAASNVILADLTIKRAKTHPIHVVSSASGHTLNTLIYNVHIVDPREQAIKINPAAAGYYVDDGIVACSHIELTDAGRPNVQPNPGGCYTGGVDAHQAMGWTIRDNLIEGFWCDTGLAEHAIHLWVSCRGTTVERNVLRNNARGVGFGMNLNDPGGTRRYTPDPCPGATGYVDHYGGVIRNNFVSADDSRLLGSPDGFDCGICLWNACDAQALHNTVYATDTPVSSSIEWRYPNTVVDIRNNLVYYVMKARNGAGATEAGNVTSAQASWFVDGASGDLHLLPGVTAAIDQGAPLVGAPCPDDIDGQARSYGSGRDVGADEFYPPEPAAVTDLRVTNAVTNTNTVTVTLSWTPPADALTTTLRFDWSPIYEGTWGMAMPLTDTLPGGSETYTTTIAFEGGWIYFALKTENDAGLSPLSNNAFWPSVEVFLPSVMYD